MFARALGAAASRARGAAAAGARRWRSNRGSAADIEVVPRVTIVLGGMGVLPFLWYGTQVEKQQQRKAGEGGGRVPLDEQAVWGDDLLRKWAAVLPPLLTPALDALHTGSQATARANFLTYSACILSFLGGVHWGAAAMAQAPQRATTQYVIGVVPSLFAWGAVMVGVRRGGDDEAGIAVRVLALSFLGIFLADELAASNWQKLPKWYTFVRSPLTTVVVGTHLVAGWSMRDPGADPREGGVRSG
jgi:hypothetical protein